MLSFSPRNVILPVLFDDENNDSDVRMKSLKLTTLKLTVNKNVLSVLENTFPRSVKEAANSLYSSFGSLSSQASGGSFCESYNLKEC